MRGNHTLRDHEGIAGIGAEEITADQTAKAICTEDLGTETDQITERVAHQKTVESHDDGGADHTEPADKGIFLSDGCQSKNGASSGTAAVDHFKTHDHHTADDDENKIEQKERESTVGPHLVRESPKVSETDGRSDGSQDKSQIAGKGRTFIHILPPKGFTAQSPHNVVNFILFIEKSKTRNYNISITKCNRYEMMKTEQDG